MPKDEKGVFEAWSHNLAQTDPKIAEEIVRAMLADKNVQQRDVPEDFRLDNRGDL